MEAVFHLYVPQQAENVTLQFSNRPKIHKDLTISLTCDKEHGAGGKYWKSESTFFDPDEVETLRYKYIVTSRSGAFKKALNKVKKTWKKPWFSKGIETEADEAKLSETKPGVAGPAGETESDESEVGDTKPGDSKHGETKPGEAAEFHETEPGEVKLGVTEPGEIEHGETEPSETETVDIGFDEAEFKHKIQGGNNYDVFTKHDNDKDREWILEGQLFYAKLLCRHVNKENWKRKVIECEHVGFANPNYTLVDRYHFFKWVSKKAKSSRLTPSKSAYICALLGQFFKDSKYHLSEYVPNSKETVNSLLLELGRCRKEYLTSISSHFIETINSLFRASSYENKLGYLLIFSQFFDGQIIIHSVVQSNLASVTDEKDFEKISTKIVKRLMKYKDKDKLNTVLNFVISESPSIDCLFKLCRVLEKNSAITDLVEPAAFKFTQFFNQATQPDLLETNMWKDMPNALKPKLANFFCSTVKEQLKQVGTSANNYAVLKSLILDKDLQKCATTNVIKLLRLTASSRNKGLSDVTCEVLNARNFDSFWNKMNPEDKEGITKELLHKKIQARQSERSTTDKDKVLVAFQVLQELSEIRAIKQCKDLNEFSDKYVCQETQRFGLEAILDAHVDIQGSSKKISRRLQLRYMELIILMAEQQQAWSYDVKLKLIEVVCSSSPATSSSQTIEIDG